MRLTTLRLTSFRSYFDAVLPCDAPRILVAGLNGVGKSSLREGVRWLLTGHCAHTDARGVGVDLLAPVGSSAVLVEADSPTLGTIRRRRNNGINEFSVGETKGEPSLQQQALYIKLNTTPEFVDAVLETEHFVRLHHAEAKALVLSLLNVKVPVGEETLTLDQLDARYKTAFDERKAAKVRLRSFAVPELPAEQMPNVDAVEAQLGRLRRELTALQQGAGAVIGKLEALKAQRAKLEGRLPVEYDPAKLAEELAALKAEADEVLAALQKIPDPIDIGAAPLEQKIALLKSRAEALRAFDPKAQGCVLDEFLPCPQTKRKFTTRAREIEIELGALPPVMVKEAGTDPQAPLRSKLDGLNHSIRVLDERKRTAEANIATNDLRQSEAEALDAQIASLGTPDQAAVDAMSQLQARIAKGELVLKHAVAYAETLKRREDALKHRATLEADVERLEGLCELLGPNGARVEALDAAVGPFTAAINTVLEPFGWTLTFDVDPWLVRVNGRPLQTYSESEQFRIGIGVQLAIAQLSGLSFAIIDRLDMLDVANRALATKMILSSPVEQVFILATREPEQALPAGKGLIAHRLGKSGAQTVILESTGV